MTAEERARLNLILDRALTELGEHFTSIQICATIFTSDVDGTAYMSRGTGDFYARRGACDRFLREDDAEDAAHTQAKIEREEDRDDWQQGGDS